MAEGDITRPDIDAMLAQNETARKRAYLIAFERIQAGAPCRDCHSEGPEAIAWL